MFEQKPGDSQENIVPGRAGANARDCKHGACLRQTGLNEWGKKWEKGICGMNLGSHHVESYRT